VMSLPRLRLGRGIRRMGRSALVGRVRIGFNT